MFDQNMFNLTNDFYMEVRLRGADADRPIQWRVSNIGRVRFVLAVGALYIEISYVQSTSFFKVSKTLDEFSV